MRTLNGNRQQQHHECMMQTCLDLAQAGAGSVSPNPMVGAVIEKNGRILGRGFHEVCGGPHAEVNALLDARRHGMDVSGATLYVNLEPCVHTGRTLPCVDSIIDNGIAEVVFGMSDPNPLVGNKAAAILESSGVAVRSGILPDVCRDLNERYVVWSEKRRPFVALKTAESYDGYIASPHLHGRFITSSAARRHVHGLRGIYDAILVGAGTVIADDPSLTVRHGRGRNPVRVILDALLRTPLDATVYNDPFRMLTVVYAGDLHSHTNQAKISVLRERGVEVVVCKMYDGRIPVSTILADLRERSLASVLVEGGARMYDEFLCAGFVDKLHHYRAPLRLKSGLAGIHLEKYRAMIDRPVTQRFGNDRYTESRIQFHRR